MAANLQSSVFAPEANTGAYTELYPRDRKRTFLQLHVVTGSVDTNFVIGGEMPTDDTRAYHVKAGGNLRFNSHGAIPIGPIYARSTGAISAVHAVEG